MNATQTTAARLDTLTLEERAILWDTCNDGGSDEVSRIAVHADLVRRDYRGQFIATEFGHDVAALYEERFNASQCATLVEWFDDLLSH